MRELKSLIKFGNNKISNNTMIFNMTTASECPSKALGMCLVCNKYGESGCYAKGPEVQYPATKPYRQAQRKAWINTTGQEFFESIAKVLDRRRLPTKYFRFNEAGDFISQGCVDKLSVIAHNLEKHFNILTFGYSARCDLRFDFASFKVKSSGHYNGNNGRTIVIDKGQPLPEGFIACPCNDKCMDNCTLCADGHDIAFIKH